MEKGKILLAVDVNINIGHTPSWVAYLAPATQPIRKQLCSIPEDDEKSVSK